MMNRMVKRSRKERNAYEKAYLLKLEPALLYALRKLSRKNRCSMAMVILCVLREGLGINSPIRLSVKKVKTQ